MQTLTKAPRSKIALALLAVYWMWGSSFVAIQICLETMPALLLMAVRFTVAGLILLAWPSSRNAPSPSRNDAVPAMISGILLIGSNAVIGVAQKYMPSSSVAAIVGAVPLWSLALGNFTSARHSLEAWRPVLIASVGVLILTSGWNSNYPIWPSLLLLASTLTWAGASIWIKHIKLNFSWRTLGLQMLAGGVMLFLLSIPDVPTLLTAFNPSTVSAMAYLIVGPSIIAYAAYAFLLNNTDTAVATSYAFVCPLVATGLGVYILHENLSINHWIALVLIIAGLLDLFRKTARASQSPR